VFLKFIFNGFLLSWIWLTFSLVLCPLAHKIVAFCVFNAYIFFLLYLDDISFLFIGKNNLLKKNYFMQKRYELAKRITK